MASIQPVHKTAQHDLPDDFSLKLCEQLSSWRFEDLPAQVVRAVKLFTIDTLGVMAGAAHAPGIAEINMRLSRWERDGCATGLIGKRQYSPPTAALANGSAAHALDFDDQHDPARVHAYCVVLPSVLATAQDAAPVDGRDFLLALAIGAEIDARLGLACHNCLGQGWHPSTLLGALAGSLAAARVLGLDAQSMRHALGIALHQACGSAQAIAGGALTKRMGPGFAARNAVMAAALAQEGITGATRPLEGDAGLFKLHSRGEATPEILLDRLGSVVMQIEHEPDAAAAIVAAFP